MEVVLRVPHIRKGSVQVRFEILEYLYYQARPQLRTHIWRRATSLSYDDFLKHLKYLEDRGLIEEREAGYYKLTKKGREIYDKLREVLPTIF